VKAQLQSGDYLFIQFGHNDSKPDTARFTDPFTTYQQYLLQYIEEARALGVTPVLMTSIHRNSWESDTLTVQDTHGDYLVAMRQLADSAEVPLIDMAVLTKALYEKYGFKRSSEEIFLNLPAGLYPAYDAGNEDNTHLQESGAYAIANLVAMAISQTADSQLLPLAAGLLPMEELFLEVSPRLGGN
ncbi:MAG: hypothetical protein NWR72_11810, partial [Bacteroidia bacterium]|nr:hypothetical protein [Bacteroidia bacterium]